MKKMMLLVPMLVSIEAQALEEVKYETFRKDILASFEATSSKEILYQLYSGVSVDPSPLPCDVLLKVTPYSTTINLIYPTSFRGQVQMVFASNREIKLKKDRGENQYSSHFIACRGDQYDTWQECWEYDHHSMTLQKDNTSKALTVGVSGHRCIIDF